MDKNKKKVIESSKEFKFLEKMKDKGAVMTVRASVKRLGREFGHDPETAKNIFKKWKDLDTNYSPERKAEIVSGKEKPKPKPSAKKARENKKKEEARKRK